MGEGAGKCIVGSIMIEFFKNIRVYILYIPRMFSGKKLGKEESFHFY